MKKLLNYHESDVVEAGCDEAGRGCLAGPVVAAAVILPVDFNHPLLNDSKKMSKKNRELLRPIIKEESLAWSVGVVDNIEIDKVNILNASFEAMHRAIAKLNLIPESLLIDGNRFTPYKNIPFHCMVKGDERFMSIAAASILAKTYRDEIMGELHAQYPDYDWLSNKGYPTVKHREALDVLGATKYHRKSFRLYNNSI